MSITLRLWSTTRSRVAGRSAVGGARRAEGSVAQRRGPVSGGRRARRHEAGEKSGLRLADDAPRVSSGPPAGANRDDVDGWPAAEPNREPRPAEPAAHVHSHARRNVEPSLKVIARAERDPGGPDERQTHLAAVRVPGEHEVDVPVAEAAHDLGSVGHKDAKIPPGHSRHGEPEVVVTGDGIVQAGDHDLPATVVDGAAAVAQEREAVALDHRRAPGARDAVPVVVVSPDEKFPVARAQRTEERLQVARATPAADEIPREYDDVRLRVVDDVEGAPLPITDRPDEDVADVHEGQVGSERREHRKILD